MSENKEIKDYGVDVHYKYSHKEFIPAVWHDVGEGTQLPFEHVPKVATLVKYYKKISPDYDFSHYDTLLRGKTAPSSQADTHQ